MLPSDSGQSGITDGGGKRQTLRVVIISILYSFQTESQDKGAILFTNGKFLLGLQADKWKV